MLVSHIDRLLARTDPFDLSQAVERHVRSLSGERIRALLRTAGPRLGAYYRDEFARLTGSGDFDAALASQDSDSILKSAFVKFLKSNLRAIPIFGNAFGLAVLEHTPHDRAVGIGEERKAPLGRSAVFGGVALALVLVGAAGERVLSGRVAAQTPQPVVILPPVHVATPRPEPHHREAPALEKRVAAQVAIPRVAIPSVTPEPIEAAAQPAARVPAVTPAPARSVAPPSGNGVAVVTAAPETPSPEPSDIDVSDMPEAYSDATPLPQQTTVPVQPSDHAIQVPTPKPSPKRHGWIHRTLSHLNPFKP